MTLLFTSITVNLFVLLVLMTTCKTGKSTLKTLTVATLYSVTTCCHKGSYFYIHVFILNVLNDCYHFLLPIPATLGIKISLGELNNNLRNIE